MKIAISSVGDGLGSRADPRFGRAPYFIFVEEGVDGVSEVRVLQNAAANSPMGAGTEAAQQVIQEGAKAVVSGAVGPNAYGIFEKMEIGVYLIQGDITVEEAYKRYKNGILQRMTIKRL